ncbi:hypothetical protein M885DRAFT_524056 [Pelagophyceae sp. CCMP2097]|nr:hypothetical protein M885DRAFT_524056 [Pelagophyceae sp. CCMP2097]
MDVLLQATDAVRSPVSCTSSDRSDSSDYKRRPLADRQQWQTKPNTLNKRARPDWLHQATAKELKSRHRSETKAEGRRALKEAGSRNERDELSGLYAQKYKAPEPLALRMATLPIGHGPQRAGSLRVTVQQAPGPDPARMTLLRPSPAARTATRRSYVAQVVPRAPLAVSVLRHEHVFNGLSSGPCARCPRCDDPAEVYCLAGAPKNAVDAHLVNVGVDAVAWLKEHNKSEGPFADDSLLRICRRGCLTYEIFEAEPQSKLARSATVSSIDSSSSE